MFFKSLEAVTPIVSDVYYVCGSCRRKSVNDGFSNYIDLQLAWAQGVSVRFNKIKECLYFIFNLFGFKSSFDSYFHSESDILLIFVCIFCVYTSAVYVIKSSIIKRYV